MDDISKRTCLEDDLAKSIAKKVLLLTSETQKNT